MASNRRTGFRGSTSPPSHRARVDLFGADSGASWRTWDAWEESPTSDWAERRTSRSPELRDRNQTRRRRPESVGHLLSPTGGRRHVEMTSPGCESFGLESPVRHGDDGYNAREEFGQYRRRIRNLSSPPMAARVSVKIPTYSGREDFSTFMMKFNSYAEYHRLSHRDEVFCLRQALDGPAAQVLTGISHICVIVYCLCVTAIIERKATKEDFSKNIARLEELDYCRIT